jgi:hypothetical protein
LKLDGRLLPVDLLDISPAGARLGTKEPPPETGHPVKLYLRSGAAIDAVVVRRTETGFALQFAERAPPELPHKTFFWKLESYVFSGAYGPQKRAPRGRHLPDHALVESCTITAWDETSARMETDVRLAIGSRVHLCGRPMAVATKRGRVYGLSLAAPL